MRTNIDYQIVADRVGAIKEQISSKSDTPVTIMAVTKGFGVEAVMAANNAGINDFGENYAQEMLTKQSFLKESNEYSELLWHFIGNLQRNKVRKIAGQVCKWHSVDSLPLGMEIAKRSEHPKVLVQVNMTGAKEQGGVDPTTTPVLVDELLGIGVNVVGLMTIGDHADRKATRIYFQKLKKMTQTLNLAECSMGMSGDYDLAIEAGTTILRLGTAIFGNRDDG